MASYFPYLSSSHHRKSTDLRIESADVDLQIANFSLAMGKSELMAYVFLDLQHHGQFI